MYAEESGEFMSVLSTAAFFVTHMIFYYFEVIQRGAQTAKEYYSSPWNIVEQLAFVVSIYYTYIRLRYPGSP